ncbi:MAG: DUF4743 domain-containing protein [bacterium]
MEAGFLRHVRACNSEINERFLPWVMEGQAVGWLRPVFADRLAELDHVFLVGTDQLEMQPGFDSFESRTEALLEVTEWLLGQGVTQLIMNEPYPVTASGREGAFCTIDRAAAAWFGVRAFGQHLNGYVSGPDGLKMWIARRAKDRLIFPGYLDNMVAGGLPHGSGLQQNLEKEGVEEANVPVEVMRLAKSVGAITYNRVTERGLRPDTLFCYDLELSPAFEPQNTDGEVEEFLCLPVEEVLELVRDKDEFKLNCNLVLTDFFIRHGLITPDHPEYLDLVTGLRQPLGLHG